MTKAELIKENFVDMKVEYQVSHHKICRKIDAIFNEEVKHFKSLLNNFNNEYSCVSDDKFILIYKNLENIFTNCKKVLVDDYEPIFNKNMELLIFTMQEFFIKKLDNDKLKCPIKQINRYLTNMCKFDYFVFENKLEDSLINFQNDFIYRYVNSEDAQRDFTYLIKNLTHSLLCQLKKSISTSIEDKQDITTRYNSTNKGIINSISIGS